MAPRITHRDPAPGEDPIADAMRLRRGPRGLTPLDTALLNAPELALAWNTFFGAVRTKTTLSDDLREIMILRVSARNKAAFEWIHHAPIAIAAGVTPRQLTVIRDLYTPLPEPSSPAPFSSLQAAALRFADISTYCVNVPREAVEDLKKFLKDDQQLLEATATIAGYNMVSRVLLALDIDDRNGEPLPLPETTEEEHEVEVESGVNLYVRTAKRADNAPWLVFINALMTNTTMWEGSLSRLSKNFNLLTYDQRGHGKSSVPPTDCTIEQLAGDVATIISTLNIPTPVRAVIGVSQGGATALALCLRHSFLFERIIACDVQVAVPASNAKLWDDRIAVAREKGMKALADITIPRWFPPLSDLRPGGAREAYVHDMITSTSLDGFAKSTAALKRYDISSGLAAGLRGKTVLLVCGERDGVLPPVMGTLKERLQTDGVEAELEIIPGSGHIPMLDSTILWLDIAEKFLLQ